MKIRFLSNYSNWLIARISTCHERLRTTSNIICSRFRVNVVLLFEKILVYRMQAVIYLHISFLIFSGARRYLMKEPDSSIPACKRRLLKIMIVDRVLRIILFGFIFYKIFLKYNFYGFGDFVKGTRNDTIIEKF